MGFETVYVGFETVCPEKDKQTAFYSPLGGAKGGLALGQSFTHIIFYWIYPSHGLSFAKYGACTKSALSKLSAARSV